MKNEIKDLINKLVSYTKFSLGKYLLHDTVKTLSKKYVTESIRKNVEFQSKTGLNPKVVRTSSGNCCEWCDKLAGTYRYPDIPDDVYRRHRGCTCTVEYYPGDGKVQNVHSKVWYAEQSKRARANYENWKEESLRTKSSGKYGVNWKHVRSKEYNEHFEFLSNNHVVVSKIAQRSRNILVHRNGKKTEEIYAIDLNTGNDIAKITNQNHDFGVKRTKKFNDSIDRAEKQEKKILFIHNHPRGYPPSVADLNELLNHKNAVGITVGHDGSVYYYTKPNKKINIFDERVAIRKLGIYNGSKEDEFILLEELSKVFGFVILKL